MKKLIFLSLFSAFSLFPSAENPSIWDKTKLAAAYAQGLIKKLMPKPKIQILTDDNSSFAIDADLINLSQTLKEELMQALGSQKDQANPYKITDQDINSLRNVYKASISSRQIGALTNIPGFILKTLLNLMQKEIIDQKNEINSQDSIRKMVDIDLPTTMQGFGQITSQELRSLITLLELAVNLRLDIIVNAITIYIGYHYSDFLSDGQRSQILSTIKDYPELLTVFINLLTPPNYPIFKPERKKNTLTLILPDGFSIELDAKLIALSPVLEKKLTTLYPGEVEHSISAFNQQNKPIEIMELSNVPEIVIKALIHLMSNQIAYQNIFKKYENQNDKKYITQYFPQYYDIISKKQLTPEKKKERITNLIIYKIAYTDIPKEIEPKLTSYSIFNSLYKSELAQEEFNNTIILLRTANRLELNNITRAVAKYIAQKYITNVEEPSWLPFIKSKEQARYQFFIYIKNMLGDELKYSILENGVISTKNLTRFLEILSTLSLDTNDALFSKFANSIAVERPVTKEEREELEPEALKSREELSRRKQEITKQRVTIFQQFKKNISSANKAAQLNMNRIEELLRQSLERAS